MLELEFIVNLPLLSYLVRVGDAIALHEAPCRRTGPSKEHRNMQASQALDAAARAERPTGVESALELAAIALQA